MIEIKAKAHQFLGTAIDDSELTSEEIASACGMNDKKTAQVIEYLKEKGFIRDCILGNPYPQKFTITAKGYDWIEDMDT